MRLHGARRRRCSGVAYMNAATFTIEIGVRDLSRHLDSVGRGTEVIVIGLVVLLRDLCDAARR